MSIPAWADALTGRVLAGKYRLVRELASGGMGAVFVAEQIALARTVAIKLVLPTKQAAGGALERFQREAQAAARVADDGVVAVLDFDYDAELGPFQVMELLAGEPLSERLRRGAMSPRATLALILDLLGVLDRVHATGIVHRDIKPSNVFLEERPDGARRVKVLDFGIARMRDAQAGDALTLPGTALGTLGYMAPEQMDGREADARADLYAVGLAIYACLTGRPPFAGMSAAETRARTQSGWVPSLRDARPDLPAAIVAAYDRATMHDPRARFATAEAFADALRASGVAAAHERGERRASSSAPPASARDESTLLSGARPAHAPESSTEPVAPASSPAHGAVAAARTPSPYEPAPSPRGAHRPHASPATDAEAAGAPSPCEPARTPSSAPPAHGAGGSRAARASPETDLAHASASHAAPSQPLAWSSIPATPARGVPSVAPSAAPEPARASRGWMAVTALSLLTALASALVAGVLLFRSDRDERAARGGPAVERSVAPEPIVPPAAPAPDPRAAAALADVEQGERDLAADRLEHAQAAFERARARLMDPPVADGSDAVVLLGRAYLGIGDVHVAHIPRLARAHPSTLECVRATQPRVEAASAAYSTAMHPRYGDIAQCADAHHGRVYDVLADTCGRGSDASRREYVRLAAFYYMRADRPGLCYEEARSGLARARASGAPPL